MALINFSLPIIPSFTKTEADKLVPAKIWDGSVTQQLLFLPDIKVLTNFAKGEIGIADGLIKKMIFSNASRIQNPETLDLFLKKSGGKLKKPSENYFKDGKIAINPEDIELTEIPGNLGGLKSLEKTLFQSIFETQKPYMEIIKLVLENLVKIEDIIARVLAISGSSMNPKNNPKALGYQGNTAFTDGVKKMDGLRNADTGPKPVVSDSTPEDNTGDPREKGKFDYVTQSVVFSTGEFDPNVDYTYIYEFAKSGEIQFGDGTFSVPPLTDDDHLPEYVILGVFDSNWNPVKESLIKTSPQEAKIDGSISKNINWINRSGKWFGIFEQIKEDRDYFFEKSNGNKLYYREEGPSVNVDGQTKYLKKGFPKLNKSSIVPLVNLFNDYYLEETSRRASKKGLSDAETQGVSDEISSRLTTPDQFGSNGIETTIEAMVKSGFLASTNPIGSPQNTSGLGSGFLKAKNPFKPKKISHKNEQIWLDPEAKYDMKIIKCDSSPNIKFYDIEEDNKKFKTTKILRFVKNTISIKLSNNADFYYEITNPNANFPIPSAGSTAEISIDNTRGSGFLGSPPLSGNFNIYTKVMPEKFRNGVIFTSQEDGTNYRLNRFGDNWKIEQIYWSINSTTREGDIISLSVYGNVKKERLQDGVQRVRVKFPDNEIYYFSTVDGQFLFKKIFDQNISDFQPLNSQRVQLTININDSTSTRDVFPLPPNSIRVADERFKFGKLISNTQILNNHLTENRPFSKGPYGTPVIAEDEKGNKRVLTKQTIEQIYRYQQTEDDTETYYIIEGILSSKNRQKLSSGASTGGSQNAGGGDYSFPDVIGVIPVFIEMLIDVFAKLIPTISSLLTLISNPPKFVTDIIIAKVGDNNGTEPEKFGTFSKKFQDDLKKLSDLTKDNTSTDPVDKTKLEEKKKKMNEFIKNSKLNNYVDVKPNGFPKFLLDGVSTIKLFGDAPILQKLPSIVFGLEVNLTSLATGGITPPPSFDFGDKISKSTELFNELTASAKKAGQSVDNFNQLKPEDITKPGAIDPKDITKKLPEIKTPDLSGNLTNPLGNIKLAVPFKLIFQYFAPSSNEKISDLSKLTKKDKQQTPSALSNSNFNPVLEVPNQVLSKAGNNFFYQVVDIQYSTGTKVEGVDYKYIYIYEDLQKTILEAEKLDEAGETTKAVALLEDAAKKDPNNGVLKDLLDELKKKLSDSVQPLIKFLLELICLPLKTIVGIITYLMDLFKSFLNPFELVVKVIEFVSFKWMLDFFNPTSKNSIFAILGMKFDIQTFLTVFIPNLIAGAQQASTKIPKSVDKSTSVENKKNKELEEDDDKEPKDDSNKANSTTQVPTGSAIPGLLQNFDLSKIIDMPFFAGKMPNLTLEQFDVFFNVRNGLTPPTLPGVPPLPKLPSLPTSLLSAILCLIEGIINSIIDFIWSLLGLGSLIPAPHLKLCRDSNQNPSTKDLADLLNGAFDDPSKENTADGGPSYNFVFNIKTSDGRDVRNLNREELDRWLEENKDLQVSFDL